MFKAPNFKPSVDLPDLSGKVIVVTGANTGIGYTTVRNLAHKGAKVYLGSRSEQKGKLAIQQLEAEGIIAGQVVWLECDIGTPALATAAAERFQGLEDRLDVLTTNNISPDKSTYDEADKPAHDGITQMMMTNHIGTFQFTQALLPLLKKTSELPGSDVRIITVASSSHIDVPRARDPKLDFSTLDSFKEAYARDMFSFMSRYSTMFFLRPLASITHSKTSGISKLANILFSSALQKRVPANIICIFLHAGTVKSTFASDYRYYGILNFLMGLVGLTADQGSFTSCFAAASTQVRKNAEKYQGKYLVPFGELGETSTNAKRVDLEEQLWTTTEKYIEGYNLD
ncbi:hypothetical protein CVT24_006924 [Panaeolus cyanescens]|uniref:NAD(P)-binding protein n=1 Tax=Panaeolus cyanescens TaxID=181874 RepID=A0A409VK33_9AGAR|nr:hypothetical protein CVT24_006924 [Panaeolus cyanescens]